MLYTNFKKLLNKPSQIYSKVREGIQLYYDDIFIEDTEPATGVSDYSARILDNPCGEKTN